jgi:hypothetical protein
VLGRRLSQRHDFPLGLACLEPELLRRQFHVSGGLKMG